MLLGPRLLLPLLLFGAMAAIEAAGSRTEPTMMTGIVTGNTANDRALEAAFGFGAIGRDSERGNDEQRGYDLHGGAFL
jgi:hypothetical protein